MVLMIVIVRMRVCDLAVGMLVRMRCARRRHHLVSVIVMAVIMGMFMGVGDRTMRVRMSVSGHLDSFCRCNRSMRKRNAMVGEPQPRWGRSFELDQV